MIVSKSYKQPNWSEKYGIMRLFRDVPSNGIFLDRETSISDESVLNGYARRSDSCLSLVPFLIYDTWFAVGIDYFEEVFERKRMYNYGNLSNLTKGMIVKDNEYFPVIDLPKIIDIQDNGNPLEIMLLLTDSSRKIVVEAGKILRPEKLFLGYDAANKSHFSSNKIILNKIKLGKLEVYILNTQNLINKIEDDSIDQ